MDPDTISEAINDALAEADATGIKGKDCTPFLLEKVKNATGGASLRSNIQLVYNNGKLAAQLAKRLSEQWS